MVAGAADGSRSAVRAASTARAAISTPAGPLIFNDEFDGTALDTAKWIAVNRDGDQANHEEQCYLPTNATVANGALTLTDRAQDITCAGGAARQYTSALVQTKAFNFTYGTLEVRARLSSGQGQWPALWLLGADCQTTFPSTADNVGTCQWPTPGSDEIDLMESFGTRATQGAFNLHSGTSPNSDNHAFGCNGVGLPFDTSTGYHTYDLVWQPGSLVWQVDGVTYCTTTSNVPNTPMFLILNVALGGSGGSPVDTSVMPEAMQVDYVRVYQQGAGIIDPTATPAAAPTKVPPPAVTALPPTRTPTARPIKSAPTLGHPTRTPTPKRGKVSSAPPLVVSLSAPRFLLGGTGWVTVKVRTDPHARIVISITLTRATIVIRGVEPHRVRTMRSVTLYRRTIRVTADRVGRLVQRIRMPYAPHSPLRGTLTVRVSAAHRVGERSAHVILGPAPVLSRGTSRR